MFIFSVYSDVNVYFIVDSNFDMDAWKRCYSNSDADVSMPYFWEHFDKENFSIWRGTYKYSDELSKIFMTCNLVGGK